MITIMSSVARLTFPIFFKMKNAGTPTTIAAPKQISCRFVILKTTLFFTFERSLGTGT